MFESIDPKTGVDTWPIICALSSWESVNSKREYLLELSEEKVFSLVRAAEIVLSNPMTLEDMCSTLAVLSGNRGFIKLIGDVKALKALDSRRSTCERLARAFSMLPVSDVEVASR